MKKSHNSHIIISCLSIFAFLTTLTTVSALMLSSSPSHAETSSVLASVTVPDVCTIAADNSSTAHTDTVGVGEYKANIGETVFNITCNDNNGYSIYAVGYSNNTVGNTNLIGTTNGATIPTGTSTATGSSAVSNWAMKLTAVSGTFPATILDSYDSYHIVPSTATKVATRTSSIDLSEDSKIKTTYAVSISPAQTADSYVGKVKYTVVHPNYSNADGTLESYPVTLSFGANTSSITIDGVTYTSSSATPNLEYGTHTISATFPEGYKLNSWSSTGDITISSTTSNPTSISVTGTGTLSVSAKVDCAETITGYMQDAGSASSYCDGASGTMTDSRDNQTYTIAKIAGALWMTRNLAIGCNGTGSTYGSSVSSKSLTSSNSNVSTTWSTPTALLSTAANSSDTSGYTTAAMMCNSTYGAWYNYVAATAGTISGSDNSTEDTYNICPKGWTLPSHGTGAGSTNSIARQDTAFSLVTGGSYYNGKLGNTDTGGWWSTAANGATLRYGLYTGGSSLYGVSNYRYRGFYVRCVRTS